ncbi:MAG: radical SAM protein, partial [Candidatus Heimdallarchaeota archaeon]|nr:radical SAM protein [Candidatus Heimdallarchaeota archaeon]
TEWLRSNNVTVTVFTNGIQIAENPDIAKKLFEMDVNVVSKLNSMNPRINDRLVGKTGAYRTFGKALDNLIEAGYTSVNNPKLGVHSIICRSNLLSIPKMWIEFREKNIIPYFQVLIPPKNINNKFYRELKVSPIALKNLFNRILEIDRKQFGFDWVPTPPLIGMDCQKSKYGVGIDAFLNVAICAFSLKHLGNIREVKRDCSKKPLTKILSLDAVNKIRWTRKFCDGKCGTCEHPFCQGGCRAAAQNAAEMIYDVTAEDNITCWYKGKYGEFDFIKKG